MNNAKKIINFKKDNMDKVDLCWSNHAISYYLVERCSGYQGEHAIDIKEFYEKNRSLYNAVYIYDNWIFSHAGVSAKWMKKFMLKTVDEINPYFLESPLSFLWVGPDNFGNNAEEGPLWIRPEALLNNTVLGFNQVSGHTENVQPRIVRKTKQIYVFCDTHDHSYLTIVDTETSSVEFVKLN